MRSLGVDQNPVRPGFPLVPKGRQGEVPADMIGVQMRAQHIVYVFGRKTGGGEIGDIGQFFL